MKCLVVGDVSPTLLTALSSRGYELVFRTKDDHEIIGVMFNACIIDEKIKSTDQWELDKVNQLSVYSNEYDIHTPKGKVGLSRGQVEFLLEGGQMIIQQPPIPKKKLKQKHKLPFWANDWRK